MTKKIICLLTMLSLVFSFSTTNYVKAASENTLQSSSLLNEKTIENAKEVLQTENLEKYLNKIESTGKLNAQIQIGDDLILEKTTIKNETPLSASEALAKNINSYSMLTTYTTTVTSTYTLKSIVGISIATLTEVGEFSRNGATVTATDSTGTVSTSYIGWSGETVTESTLSGSTTGYSWAKAKFSLKYYIGIDPVGMTLQTVEVAAKVYCNPSGSYYSEWS